MEKNNYRKIIITTLKIILSYIIYLIIGVYLDGNPFSFIFSPRQAPLAFVFISSILLAFIIQIAISAIKQRKKR